MEFNFEHLNLDEHQIKAAGTALGLYLDELKEVVRTRQLMRPEAALLMPMDQEGLEAVLDLKHKMVDHGLKYVVVVGIGGSNLGAKAVYDATAGFFDALEPGRMPKLLFADTVDGEWMMRLSRILETRVNSANEVLVVVVSKSGKTVETTFNAEAIWQILERQFGVEAAKKRIAVVTDRGSALWRLADDYGFSALEIVQSVGGRYSVLTAAGLFPLAAAGFDVRGLLEGAHSILDHSLERNVLKNAAARSAISQFLYFQKGRHIQDTFVFNPELESLGKWYRQLLAESVGKESFGITPTVSIGSVDLHSMAQLYFDGPAERVTTFVMSSKRRHEGLPPRTKMFRDLAPVTASLGADDLMRAIFQGVGVAYAKASLPFMTVTLPGVSEYSLGQFMQWKMVEVMLIAKLFGVNAFDQPGVELYKQEIRNVLAE